MVKKPRKMPDLTIPLTEKICVPCQGGVLPLKSTDIKKYLSQLDGWQAVKNHHITKTYLFKNFSEALAFVNRVGKVAEENSHHPDLLLTWGKTCVDIWTHKINGLTESDFILAAKCDQVFTQI